MEVAVYKMDGSKAGSMNLPDSLFAVEVNAGLVHEAIVTQEANSRIRYSQTKDRSEVRGGGKKPWRQKGTGRARHGSRRSPIWVGGGITFGPDAFRIFGKKINKRAKRKALAMALTDKVNEQSFIIVEDLKLEAPKTKLIQSMREKLPGSDASALIVAATDDKSVGLATRNLTTTAAIPANAINVRDVVKYKFVIASKDAVEAIINQFAK